jgi:hypothetical protein
MVVKPPYDQSPASFFSFSNLRNLAVADFCPLPVVVQGLTKS